MSIKVLITPERPTQIASSRTPSYLPSPTLSRSSRCRPTRWPFFSTTTNAIFGGHWRNCKKLCELAADFVENHSCEIRYAAWKRKWIASNEEEWLVDDRSLVL
jgi:hypothetical protein